MAEFLEKILASTREDLGVRMRRRDLAAVKSAVGELQPGPRSRSLIEALRAPGMSVIAEVKRASPSKGDIRPGLDVAEVVSLYERAGASAISVLTEERHFKGSLDDLRAARQACGLPLLRKDFIVDPYQIWEAAEAGADAVLLIVAALSPSQLDRLLEESVVVGVDCLVEVHNAGELEIAKLALDSGPPAAIGINNRDLRTFEVHLETTLNLIKSVPEGMSVVSESGIRNREDVDTLADAGVKAVLIGETLMRSPDPGAKLRELLSASSKPGN
ncbi:MAG: indole-3-glycerol phosphate synthase TrpC [Thermoleophilia bacterium]